MGAGLPSYSGLVRKTYAKLGATPPADTNPNWVWPDRLLGELEAASLPGAVRAAVATILSAEAADLTLHDALLKLARLTRHPGIRLVTTNFDTYFEKAAPSLEGRFHSGPVLPVPRDDRSGSWQSLVYLHGRLQPPAAGNDHLILTSADFGRAYLTDAWAARFVARLFAEFSVLFVGYSLNDPVLRYMADAFASESREIRRAQYRPRAYIFVSYEGEELTPDQMADWRHRGMQPIFYQNFDGHRLLRDTLVRWAVARGDWLSSTEEIIRRLATSKPEVHAPSDASNLIWALFGRREDDGYGARLFADLPSLPPIDWLEAFEQHESALLEEHREKSEKARLAHEPPPPCPTLHIRHLAASSRGASSSLTNAAFHVARWLTRHLDRDEFIDWVATRARGGERLHPRFRDLIRGALSKDTVQLSETQRRFWRIVSSEARWAVPPGETDYLWDFSSLLIDPGGEELVRAELLDALRPIIRLSPSTWRIDWSEFGDALDERVTRALSERFARVADAEVELIGGDQIRHVLDSLDKSPGADDRVGALADGLTALLKEALDLWALIGEASSTQDLSTQHQPSIPPHAQNLGFHRWTILIDLLWRSWKWVNNRSCRDSRRLIEHWLSIPYPTFQRLALQAIGESGCWTADEKLEFLINGF